MNKREVEVGGGDLFQGEAVPSIQRPEGKKGWRSLCCDLRWSEEGVGLWNNLDSICGNWREERAGLTGKFTL